MNKARKFGAFSGVFTPSILSILGVIMFLRMPWIVGQAGLWNTLGIILVAHVISIATGLSVSSVATDKRVETGGSYYIISRSMGLAIGGTLGVALFIGLSFSVSLYLLGFAETFLAYFGFEVSLYTIRIAGTLILLVVTALTFISTSLAIRTQYLIMAAIVLSLISVFLGSHEYVPGQPVMRPSGDALPWIALFAVFFPAVTGFQAGLSMSGDLKNPRKNLPMGTMMAIAVGLLVYIGLAFFFAYSVERDMLVNDPQVLFNISLVPQLVIAGILGATVSSGLAAIMVAPRILQAVAMDRILPGFFARGHGASREPRNALILAFFIALAGILIGDLNVIARLISIFFIIIYGFLNITYTLESWAGSDFRPSFRIPRSVSIIGALACIIVMIQLDLPALILASILLFGLFVLLKKKELTLQSGDTWMGVWSSVVKTGLTRLAASSKKVRNWRPNVLLFSGGEKSRPHLLEMGRALVGKMGVFTNFELTEQPSGDSLFGVKENPRSPEVTGAKSLFTRRHSCRDIYEGIDIISRVYGFTGFEPNTVLMGWPGNTRHPEKFEKLLLSLKRQDHNCVFLNYDKTHGFGHYQTIDVWWKGSGRGLSLALSLLRFLTTAGKWHHARLRILVINDDSPAAEALYNLIRQMLENNRMPAVVKVINNGVEQLPEEQIIAAESQDTDLTIFELPDIKHREIEGLIDRVNGLTSVVNSALLLSPSSVFEAIREPVTESGEEIVDSDIPERPVADVLKNVKPASREIISQKVENIGQKAGHFIQKYFEQGPESMLKLDVQYYPVLRSFTSKTLDALQKVAEKKKPADKPREFLRILNDFSFHSQRHIQQIRDQRVTAARQILDGATQTYLNELRAMMNVMPEKIRVRLQPGEITIKKQDRLKTKLYKARKIFVATVTRRPVSHKIRVLPAARYFLYHNRLRSLQAFMSEFSHFSVTEVVELRKLFNNVYELIEKARLEPDNKAKNLERVKLERNRLLARVTVMENQNRQFYYDAGRRLFDELAADLGRFSHHLESTEANIHSRGYFSYTKHDTEKVEALKGFAPVWERNLSLFINKALLDFYILSLKSRIHSKIKKYNNDFAAAIETGLVKHIEAFEASAVKLLQETDQELSGVKKLDHAALKPVAVPEIYQGLYAEIGEVVREIPDKMEISDEHLAENIGNKAFAEAGKVEVSPRKSVEYFTGTELIDFTIKRTHDAELQLQKRVTAIKDMVRLLNFSIEDDFKQEDKDDAGKQEQLKGLFNSFLKKIRAEKEKVRGIIKEVEDAFEEGLKKGFEPLSSSTIGQTSLAVRKRAREADKQEFSGRLHRFWQQARNLSRDRLVDLLYRKSEGQLWISHLEKDDEPEGWSNNDLLTLVETFTPNPAVLNELPYFYRSLFAGKSGAGEDFWVGMETELRDCTRAVRRFKAGFAGALFITGVRSSGKSSLSKKIAEDHFARDNIHAVRAPQGCTADVDLFSRKLTEALGAHSNSLDDIFLAMPAGKAIIIQDLELWWERRSGGNAVVERIKSLIDRYGHKCLFIINVNSHALQLINAQNRLASYALATVGCEAFDARELKEMVMRRHQAGGLSFRYKKKDEEAMTTLEQARLFNALFNLSFGNPGTATILWLSAIRKVSGKVIHMDPFRVPKAKAFDRITPEQWFYIQQFVVHRRLSANMLATNLETSKDKVMAIVYGLMRAGILIEKFEGVYAIRSGLDAYLLHELKKKKRL